MPFPQRVLFLHPNFPAQFRCPLIALGKKGEHDVRFLCFTDYGNYIKGIKKLKIKGEKGQEGLEKYTHNELEKTRFRAESYRSAFKQFKNQGWNPDIVIGHTGWGCGIHVKEIWPDTKFIAYVEWWFNPESILSKIAASHPFLPYGEEQQNKLWKRNQPIGFELCTADEIIAPTHWQKNQLPKSLANKCRVVRDGIDTKFYRPKETNAMRDAYISFGTRGMEPMRCFKEFIKVIPALLANYPEMKIRIAGEDKICYGGYGPSPKKSWGNWAKEALSLCPGMKNRMMGHREKDI